MMRCILFLGCFYGQAMRVMTRDGITLVVFDWWRARARCVWICLFFFSGEGRSGLFWTILHVGGELSSFQTRAAHGTSDARPVRRST